MFDQQKNFGFGFMRLPLLNQDDPESVDTEQVKKMVDLYMSKGFNYFDTAYMYHKYNSERVLKEVLVDRYPRKSFTIADKMPVSHLERREDLERFFNEQLSKTGAGYFDYYLLHNLFTSSYEKTETLGGFEYLVKLKREGKVRYIGFSYHDRADLLDRILKAHPEVDFVQLQINYLDWESEIVQAGANYETAVKYGKPVIIMEPVKGGNLVHLPEAAEKKLRGHSPYMSNASWAVRFAASLDHVYMVLSGMSSLKQMEDNISFMEHFKPLDSGEKQVLHEVTEEIIRSITIPCTACGYCVECPKKIEIPAYFRVYNDAKRAINRGVEEQKESYQKLSAAGGKPEDCIKCRKCEKLCPQHIEITKRLCEIGEYFSNQEQK